MPLDNTPSWTLPLTDEDIAVIDRAITILKEGGWCTGRSRDLTGRHCILGAIWESGGSVEQYERVTRKLTTLLEYPFVNNDPLVDMTQFHNNTQAMVQFNNAQASVDPVIAFLERARPHGRGGE